MQINSIATPLPIDNIDTDQIIPAKFLKQVDKLGYGKNLFYNWRYTKEGTPDESFELNKPERKESTILVVGNNFGCGSSREHAAWAIADYGIKAIVSTQFADIFKGNAYNNGILPIVLPKSKVEELMAVATEQPSTIIEIDLAAQTISCAAISFSEPFDIHPFKKTCLMEGVDETAFLINMRSEIQEFEKQLVDL